MSAPSTGGEVARYALSEKMAVPNPRSTIKGKRAVARYALSEKMAVPNPRSTIKGGRGRSLGTALIVTTQITKMTTQLTYTQHRW